jgi:hypothetical protein
MEWRASNVGLCLGLGALTYVYLKLSGTIYNWFRIYVMLRKLPRPQGTGALGVSLEALTPRRHVAFSGLNPAAFKCQNMCRNFSK